MKKWAPVAVESGGRVMVFGSESEACALRFSASAAYFE